MSNEMTAAQAAQQNNRENSGRYASKEFDEAAGGLGALDVSESVSDRHSRFAFDEAHDTTDEWAYQAGMGNVSPGCRTPWGEAQNVEVIAPGIVDVDTASHGGVKLSPARNKLVPAALRQRSGWYEEDCEAYVVSAVFPEAVASGRRYGGDTELTDPDFHRERAWERLREWLPDDYENATGIPVEPGQSKSRDDAVFNAEHRDDFVANGALSQGDGTTKVWARRASDGTEREYVVPVQEYKAVPLGRYVVDEATAKDITPPPVVRTPATSAKGTIDPAALGVAGRKKLAKSYRVGSDVKSVGQMIEGGWATGKQAWRNPDTGRVSYTIVRREHDGDSSYSSVPITKDIYDAFDAPDERHNFGS
jgi:hypothetical protein